MLTKMHLKNFKGFRDTEIPEFRKVNLILGGQNVGKTSLLEAVVFGAGQTDSSQNSFVRLPKIFRLNEGGDSLRFWNSLMGSPKRPAELAIMTTYNGYDYLMGGYATGETLKNATQNALLYFHPGATVNSFNDIHIAELIVKELGEVRWIWGHGIELPIEVSHQQAFSRHVDVSDCFPTFQMSAAAQVNLYGRLVTGKKKKALVELLKKIEPRLESIDAVAPDGEHRVYADLSDGRVLPLSQLGHGFTRLFELYSGLAVTESKLALIDEIENGIHYSALPAVLEGIRELADSNDVQSIITTHSLEAIEAACEVFKDRPDDFQLIRLERTNDNNIRAVAIADESLKIVMASGWEMR